MKDTRFAEELSSLGRERFGSLPPLDLTSGEDHFACKQSSVVASSDQPTQPQRRRDWEGVGDGGLTSQNMNPQPPAVFPGPRFLVCQRCSVHVWWFPFSESNPLPFWRLWSNTVCGLASCFALEVLLLSVCVVVCFWRMWVGIVSCLGRRCWVLSRESTGHMFLCFGPARCCLLWQGYCWKPEMKPPFIWITYLKNRLLSVLGMCFFVFAVYTRNPQHSHRNQETHSISDVHYVGRICCPWLIWMHAYRHACIQACIHEYITLHYVTLH